MSEILFTPDSYGIYLRIKTVIENLQKDQLTAVEIAEKTGIPISTVYKLTNILLIHNVIRIAKYEIVNDKKRRVFEVTDKVVPNNTDASG